MQYNNQYQQSGPDNRVSMPPPKQSAGDDEPRLPRWIVRYVIVPIIVAIIGTGAFFGVKSATSSSTTPTPGSAPTQPTIPQLHGSYNGSAINDGTPLNFVLTQLVEQNDGSFIANGSLGFCTITVQGTVTDTDDITFTAQQTGNCSPETGTFTGKVSNNGATLAGTWDVENSTPQQGGNWNLS